MAIAVTDTEKSYSNVIAGNPVSVPMPLDAQSELYVYYGSTRVLAVANTDYVLQLDPDGDDSFASFIFTPTASLITKIGVEGAGNVVYLVRSLALTSDLQANDTYFRDKLVKAIDRILMRFQTITNRMKTGVDHNITISEDAPSSGEDGDIWLKVPPT